MTKVTIIYCPMLSKRNMATVALHVIALQEIKPDLKGHMVLKDIETLKTKKFM